ncbi:MAG: hypothetical protein R6T78_02555, partial [Dehalococcoidales bacterium]
KGVRTIARIRDIVAQLRLRIKRQSVVINPSPDKLPSAVEGELERLDIEPAAMIPQDNDLYQYDVELRPLIELPDSSVAVRAVDDLMARLTK